MKKDRYNLKTSRAIYEVYKTLYLAKDSLTPSELSKKMGRNLKSVSDQLVPLRKKGFVDVEKKGRERLYKINEEKFIELTGFKKKDWEKKKIVAEAILYLSQNFKIYKFKTGLEKNGTITQNQAKAMILIMTDSEL